MNRSLFVGVVAACALVACSTSLRRVREGRNLSQDSTVVEFPPPPAQIEELREARRAVAPCAWVDGHWQWIGRRWEWSPGYAVLPSDECYYAPPDIFWVLGKLHYRPPGWYSISASERGEARLCAAPKACPNANSATLRPVD